MSTVAKVYVLNKAKELILKGIYQTEITQKTKAGIEKLDAVADGFWDRLRVFIKKEKEIDRKWIPDVIEQTGEEAVHEVIRTLRKELEPSKLIQEIFDIEKKENPEIF